MAKNLQNILNDVVGEILTEAENNTNLSAVLNPDAAAAGGEDLAAIRSQDAVRKLALAGKYGTAAAQRAAFGQNPLQPDAGEDIPDPRSITQRLTDAYNDSPVVQWAHENPGYAALAGAGIGSALAAGAGALYLRKKQREANKAAGLR